MLKVRSLWFPCVAALAFLLFGQAPAGQELLGQEVRRDTTHQGLKKMTVDDYALWRTIGETSLSPDGSWVTYAYSQREVDDSLFFQPLGGGDPHIVVRGSQPRFSGDSRWAAYYVNPKDDSGSGGRSNGSSGNGASGRGSAASRSLELLDLRSRQVVRWENIQDFGFAESGAALVLKKRKADRDAEHDGTDLLIRYLADGSEELVSYVDEWAFDEAGRRLAYTLDTPKGESNAVHVLELATRIRSVLDAEREAHYVRLSWGDERDAPSADALAVLKGKEDDDLVETVNALLLWPALGDSKRPITLDPRPAKDSTDGRVPDPVTDGWVLSEKGPLRWSRDADRIFVSTRPQAPSPKTLCKPAKKGESRSSESEESKSDSTAQASGQSAADSGAVASAAPTLSTMASRYHPDGRPLGPEEVMDGVCPDFMADVDIWHIGDERLQSVQMVRANRDRNQVFTSVVHLPVGGSGAKPQFVQLADETMESLEVSLNGRVAMGRDDRPYRSDWKPRYSDYYLVDMETGDRTPVLEEHLRTLGFSPTGSHYLYWKDASVWAYRTDTEEHVNLTADFPVSLVNEEFDRLGEKPPHGVAGWSMDSTSVILRDRYDLYLQPLGGGAPINLTLGRGAEDEIRFRVLDLDPEEDLLDLEEPLFLTAFGQWTKKDGFFRLDGAGTRPILRSAMSPMGESPAAFFASRTSSIARG